MIDQVKGQLIKKKPKSLVIMLGGLGLEVFANIATISKLNLKQEVLLHTYLHVREDVLSLYGFETENERDFYLSLLKVSGVGPKLALDILEMQLGKLKKAIKEKNSALLSQIKGLGKKTAEKIILELSSKIDDLEIVQVSNSSEVSSDVISLLENLGFNQKQIFHKLADLPGEYQDSEAIVRWFLKEQNK